MPEVSPIGSGPVSPLSRATTPLAPEHLNGDGRDRAVPEPPLDRVEVSEHARLLDQLRQLPDIRSDRVESVKAAIEGGGYETEERLNAAIDKLLEDLGPTD